MSIAGFCGTKKLNLKAMVLLSVVAYGLVVTTGCATSSNDFYNEYWTKSSPVEQTSFVTDSRDWYGDSYKLGYHVDLAMSQLRQRRTDEASKSLQAADDVIDEHFKKDYAGLITSFTLSETSSDYVGDPYEQVQIPMLRSLIFAQEKNWEKSLAMARRTNDTIQTIVQKLAKVHGFEVDSTQSSTRSKSSSNKKKALKWHYVKDAFAYYVASAAAYNQRDYENALSHARNSVLTYTSPVYKNNYLVKKTPENVAKLYCHLAKTIDQGPVRDIDKSLVDENCAGVEPMDTSKGEAVVVVLHGRGATKQSLNVDLVLDKKLVDKLVAGAAVPLFQAFTESDKESSDGKTAGKDVSAGKTNKVFGVLMGLVLADPYINDQIALQVDDLTKKGSKGFGSGVANAVGALSDDVMRLSVPVYLWYPTSKPPQTVSLGENAASSRQSLSLVSNLDGIRDRELFDTMNMSMLRSISRGFFRLALAEGAGKAGGFWAKLGVGAVTKTAESSETRSLRALPQSIYTISTSLKEGTYPLSGNGISFAAEQLKVEANKINFVIAYSGT